ncbi:MAG: dTDP-glucose 4,6-dehydratase [Candidatus Omnitrophica bacterium]|nr:dTDP-glucose 4,6-dehydratase [Candidatus Omnitrophota bacterium]
MKNILITGGCGFIGSNFIHYMLNNYDYKIINLDALTYAGNLENLKSIEGNPNYKFIKGRIEDRKLVSNLIKEEGISFIVHFAAESHVDRSITDSIPFIKTNIVGTHVLLEAAKENNIEKFIHISTDEVYGSLGPTGVFTELTPIQPNSPYSASKASSDLLVRSYVETFKFPATIVRCTNNYGPYQFPEKYIPLTISNVLDNQPIPLYGDGLNVRDWIYTEDFCRAIDVVLHKGRIGEVYNAGGNSEETNINIAKIILKHLNKPKSLITYVKDRLGHDRRYAMDITKIKNELGWQLKYKFEEGIEKTIEWYRQNKGWWMKIKSGEYLNYYKKMYGQRLQEGMQVVKDKVQKTEDIRLNRESRKGAKS